MVKQMNPEVKGKWLSALRSGKYEQGRQRLNKFDREFCCLGVLCEVAVDEEIVTKSNSGGYGKDEMTFGLPVEVRKWSGVSLMGDLGPTEDFPTLRSLSGLNDHGLSFEDIADVIEREL